MDLQVAVHNGWKILTPAEEKLDAYVSQELKKALTDSVKDGAMQIVLDLSRVGAVDSSGLGALVFFKQYVGEDTRVVISAVSPAVGSVLALTHLDEVFEIVDRPESLWEETSPGPSVKERADSENVECRTRNVE